MKITKRHIKSFFALSGIAAFELFMMNVALPSAMADQSLLNGQMGLSDVGSSVYGNSAPEDIRVTIVRVINTVLEFLSLIFLVLVLVAGFKYMTSQGNDDKISKAVGQLKAAIIGLVIVLASWGITRWLLSWIVCRTTSQAACSVSWIR